MVNLRKGINLKKKVYKQEYTCKLNKSILIKSKSSVMDLKYDNVDL